MRTYAFTLVGLSLWCCSAGCVGNSQLGVVTAERDQLVAQLEEVRGDLDKLRADCNAIQDASVSASRIRSLHTDLDRTRTCLQSTERLLQQREEELSALRGRASSLNDQLRKVSAENLSLRQQVAAIMIPVRAAYRSAGDGHWIRENIGEGTYIILEDGSLWRVEATDRIDAGLWMQMDSIVVVETPSGYSPYKLLNDDTGETVGAEFIGSE